MTENPLALRNRPFRPQTPIFGLLLTQGCALGYRRTALQALIAKIRTAQTKDSRQRTRGPTGFMGNDKASAPAMSAGRLQLCSRQCSAMDFQIPQLTIQAAIHSRSNAQWGGGLQIDGGVRSNVGRSNFLSIHI